MNDLSWFLYLAGALPQLSTAIAIVSALAALFFAILFFIYLCEKEDDPDSNVAKLLEPYRHVWWVCAIVFTMTFLVPSKETFYAIAASEMGEEVLNSKIGTKAQRALESWLDKQMGDNVPAANDDAAE